MHDGTRSRLAKDLEGNVAELRYDSSLLTVFRGSYDWLDGGGFRARPLNS
jgi:hypothetical protein